MNYNTSGCLCLLFSVYTYCPRHSTCNFSIAKWESTCNNWLAIDLVKFHFRCDHRVKPVISNLNYNRHTTIRGQLYLCITLKMMSTILNQITIKDMRDFTTLIFATWRRMTINVIHQAYEKVHVCFRARAQRESCLKKMQSRKLYCVQLITSSWYYFLTYLGDLKWTLFKTSKFQWYGLSPLVMRYSLSLQWI